MKALSMSFPASTVAGTFVGKFACGLVLLLTLLTSPAVWAQSAVSFDYPSSGSTINLQNVTKLYLQGNCDVAGESISVTVGAQSSMSVTCNTSKVWSVANVSIASLADGPVQFKVVKASNPSIAITRTYIKDTYAPVLVVNAPKSGDSILSTNVRNFVVSGICSEVGQPVLLTLKRAVDDGTAAAISQSMNCPSARSWSTTFDLTSLGDNTDVQLIASHTDDSGNQNIQSSSYYMDVQVIATGFAGLPAFINSTNAAAVVINGSCNKNNSSVSLTVKVAGTAYEQNLTTNCVNGSWQFNTLSFAGSNVPDGSIQLTLMLLNPLTGQIGTNSSTLIKDTVPPTLTIASPVTGYRMTQTTGTSLTIRGACSENGRAVTVTGAASGSAACTSGAYTATFDLAARADGDQAFAVTTTDAAGNSRTQSFSINKDTKPASVTINSIASINASTATSVVLSGTCSEFGAYAQPVQISGAISATAICQSAGTWSLNLSSFSVADGSVVFRADHADAAGNRATQAVLTVTKDTVPPTLTITSPVLPVSPSKFMITNTNKASVVFGGACSKAGATISASGKLSGTAVCTNGAWSLSGASLANVADGDLTISFRIADAVGNASQQDIIIFKDTLAPTITVAGSPYKSNVTSTANIALSGACSEHGSYAQPVIVTGVDASALTAICNAGTWTLSVAKTKFIEGTSTFTVTHKDMAGNSSSATGTVIKDSTPPAVTIQSSVTVINRSNVASVTFSGTCSENGINVALSGATAGSAACASNAWATTLNLTSVAEGNLSFAVTQTDAAGNSATQSLVRVKDTVAPTLTIAAPAAGQDVANAGNFNISGVCSENGRAVTIAGTYSGTALCTSGTWTLSVAAGTSSTASITADLSDAVGNSSSVARSFSNSKANTGVLLNNRLSMGYNHGCVVDKGALKCWGDNGYSQIGDGTTQTAYQLTTVISSGVQSVSAGTRYTCAVVSGAVKCWGANQLGSLGGPTPASSASMLTLISSGATAVNGTCAIVNGAMQCWGYNPDDRLMTGVLSYNMPVTATKFTSGVQALTSNNGCAIISGSVKCWGYGYYGRLGSGSTANSLGTAVTVVASGAQALSSSVYNACAVVNGALQCWGASVGTWVGGSSANALWPVTVIPRGVQAVAVGESHACAIVAGALQCWGDNSLGSLGKGDLISSAAPVTVISSGVTDIAINESNTCAIANGNLSCWGNNDENKLVFTARLSSSPSAAIASGVQDASTGSGSTCAVVAGALQCWGSDGYSVSIAGAEPTSVTPKIIIASGVQSVATGVSHKCAIVDSGVKCWGYNGAGQLGNGTTTSSLTPVSAIANGVQAIASSGNATCAIANGSLSCWGSGATGINALTRVPTMVIASGVQSVSAGMNHTCAVVNSALLCWGNNNYGQLGDGTTVSSVTPLTVIPSGVQAVAAGANHTCALMSGAVKCWGHNGLGQLGNGTTVNSLTPVIAISSGVQSIALGSGHSCALASGSLKCWGSNQYGQLGNGSSVNSNGPVNVASGVVAVKSSGYSQHTCAISTGGGLACWGSNLYGQANPSARLSEIRAGTTIQSGL